MCSAFTTLQADTPSEVVDNTTTRPIHARPMNVLVLYDHYSTFTATVREYLEAFQSYSEHHVYFAVGTRDVPCQVDLDWFDAVIVTYSVRLSLPDLISPHMVDALKQYQGLKVLTIQDEYENTNQAHQWMKDLHFDVVYSVVPQPYLADVYPPKDFPNTVFKSTLTGFIPDNLAHLGDVPPIADRPIVIGYRGRALPYWYGDLGQDKIDIARRMRPICQEKGIPVDIEWENDKRIYGSDWYAFQRRCRSMLGTESGANIFDPEGSIRKRIEAVLEKNPELTYAEARAKGLVPPEGTVQMNQISPKFFEAIANRTALVLFEGGYSGVLEAHRHYISLKKDFSNVEDVLAQLDDVGMLQVMVDRTYDDVVGSGRYSYETFVKEIDATLNTMVDQTRRGRQSVTLVTGVVGVAQSERMKIIKTFVTDEGLMPLLPEIPMTGVLEMPKKKPKPKFKRTPAQKLEREVQRLVKRLIAPLNEWIKDLQ